MDVEVELRELLRGGHVLAGRVGYVGGCELRAKSDGTVERVDHDGFVQLIVSRGACEVVVRMEEPDVASPRVCVLRYDPGRPTSVIVQVGPLYLGGPFVVEEAVDDPKAAEARWRASQLAPCWVERPEPRCC